MPFFFSSVVQLPSEKKVEHYFSPTFISLETVPSNGFEGRQLGHHPVPTAKYMRLCETTNTWKLRFQLSYTKERTIFFLILIHTGIVIIYH